MILEALKRKSAGICRCGIETTDAVRVRSAGNAAEEALVIEEVVAGENVLEIRLLEEIAGGKGDLAERFVGMIVGPFLKDIAGFREFLNVKTVESFFEFGNGRKRGRIG